jgi:hypothetical protein
MAQVIKAYAAPTVKVSIGARYLTKTEVTLGTEYLTKGFVVEPLKLGLPDGLVDAVFVQGVAGNTGTPTASLVASAYISGGNVYLQLFNSVTGAENALTGLTEEATKGAKGSEYKVTLVAIGR